MELKKKDTNEMTFQFLIISDFICSHFSFIEFNRQTVRLELNEYLIKANSKSSPASH